MINFGDDFHMKIDAGGVHYKQLNEKIREMVKKGEKRFDLVNINGQRYIGAGLVGELIIEIEGVPGNDLACFMDGPEIIVKDNAQDGVCNTMNDGKVVIHGDAGDVLGYGMRGGRLYVKGDVGYRVGIHMKAYKEKVPTIVIGGCARDFLGEYMAGGNIIVLNLDNKADPVGNFVGTGMHGGNIFVRETVKEYQIGKEVGMGEMTKSDRTFLKSVLEDYGRYFNPEISTRELSKENYTKLYPKTKRPYGNLYAY
ncbi:MAG: hypothetical protein MOIL_00082 [Candidatus Methanolliviera sp. GoM_oil]|nr:MAG: hypothetical protein MOIL_00082 [Candidatus Methanolliviera sp. GoM_oil]